MGVKLHIHRSGRDFTVDTAKPAPSPQPKKTHDCACHMMKAKDGETQQKLKELMQFFGLDAKGFKDVLTTRDQTPGVDRIKQSLDDWREEQRITQAEIDAAIPSAKPALQRILQNQTIRIKQLEMELFRLQRDNENAQFRDGKVAP
jgi:hypothetical protein